MFKQTIIQYPHMSINSILIYMEMCITIKKYNELLDRVESLKPLHGLIYGTPGENLTK